jgi:hypothetical protein
VDGSIFSWEEATCCSVALNFFCIAILKREPGGLCASYRNGECCWLGVEEPSSQPGGPKVGCWACSLTKPADPGMATSRALSFFRRHLHTPRGLQPLHACSLHMSLSLTVCAAAIGVSLSTLWPLSSSCLPSTCPGMLNRELCDSSPLAHSHSA